MTKRGTGEPSAREHGLWATGDPSSNGVGPGQTLRRAVRLITLGYIMAIAIPPAGLVLGIYILTRRAMPHARHGAFIIALSMVGAVIWVLVFATGALTDANSNLSGY